WPIYHSLQDRGIVSLASPGTGVLAVVDDVGQGLESVNNGVDWREVPLPEGVGRPVAVTLGAAPGSIGMTSRPLGLYSRVIGDPLPAREGPPDRLRSLLERARRVGGGATAVATERTRRPPGSQGKLGWSALGVPPVADRSHRPSIRALAV